MRVRTAVDAFTERYPHGSFREYEAFDHRYGKAIRCSPTEREQAMLRRVEKALAPRSSGEERGEAV